MGHGPVSPGQVTDTPGRVADFGFLFAIRSSTVASVTVEFVEFDGGRDSIIMASMVVMMEEMSSMTVYTIIIIIIIITTVMAEKACSPS